MRIESLRCTALLVALWLPATMVSAQWDASTQEGSYTAAPAPPPAPPNQMISDPAYPAAEDTGKMKGWQPAAFTWSLNLGVPIVLDVPRDVVRPGADIFFFGAADFGWFVIGGDFGLMWTPIDLNNLNIVPGVSGRRPLSRIYVSLPEARFQVPDLKVALPYVSFAFDLNFWNFAETGIACGYWYCSEVSVYRFTPGFTGKAGAGFEVKDSGVYIDVGFKYSFTGKGSFFARTGWWLEPYVGVLVRRRD